MAVTRRQSVRRRRASPCAGIADAAGALAVDAVALITMANGGDNLGVYIPLFSRELPWVPVYAGVFAVMTGVWCTAGHWLVHHPILGARIRQYGHVALPFVLIGLGLHILSSARALLQ